MEVQILDLDGSLLEQHGLVSRLDPPVVPLRRWGPRIRLGCGFRRYRRFDKSLASRLGARAGREPAITLYGSGDFHHVSLALLQRIRTPFNLLVVDKHPDWMRGVPFLHCGTWLYHAAQLPQVRQVFHVGGDVDFDNYYRWMAPWDLIGSGRITVFPAVRRFRRGRWAGIETTPVRSDAGTPFPAERMEELIAPYRDELCCRPLYISLDKDVMIPDDAAVNWDSGRLTLAEVQDILRAFAEAARGRLVGMDVLGDWSKVRLRGLSRRCLHLTEHPALDVEPAAAAGCNEATNLALLRTMGVSTVRSGERAPAKQAA